MPGLPGGSGGVSLTIAIDFDKTFTADPVMWRRFVVLALGSGHRVVMVTGRADRVMHSDPSRHWGNEVRAALAEQRLTVVLPVLFAGDMPKRLAAEQAGYQVDIWIDDDPENIGGGR